MMNRLYIRLVLMLSLVTTSLSLYGANDEAQYNFLKKEYTINEDGSYSKRVVKELKLLTHKSFNSLYGETFIVYNPKIETLKIDECYTISADGTKVETPENAFNEVLPSFAASAPAYNHLKEMVVTHTGLEIGATIYLDYTITTAPCEDGSSLFDIQETIEESSPIKEYTISITAPASSQLRYKLLRSQVKPKISGNKVTYTFKGVAANAREYLAPENGVAPILLASTIDKSSSQERLSSGCGCEYIKGLAAEITTSLSTEDEKDEKVKAIFNYAIDRMDNSKIPFRYQEYQVRPLQSVISSGYATNMERAMVIKSLLDAEGISYIMMVRYSSFIPTDIFTLSALKGIYFKIGESYYSPLNSKPTELASIATRDNFYTISGGDYNRVEIQAEPQTKSYSANISADMASESGYIVYSPEDIIAPFDSWHTTQLTSSRKTPLELPEVINLSSRWSITTEDGVKMATPEFTTTMKCSFGELKISLSKESGKVILDRSIEFTTQEISPKEYAKFREFITTWLSNKGSKLLFEVAR